MELPSARRTNFNEEREMNGELLMRQCGGQREVMLWV